MSIIVQNAVKDYYNFDETTGWYSVNFEKINCQEQAKEVANQCSSDAQLERLKACSKVVMGGGIALLLTGLSVIAYKLSILFVGTLILPLVIIPPLYGLITMLAGFGASGGFLYLTVKKYTSQFFNQAKEHWNYGNHLYSEAHRARLETPKLSPAKA